MTKRKKLLVQGIAPKSEHKEAQAENILSKQLLVNGMPVTSDEVKTIDRAFFAILSFIYSLTSVRPTFASSKPATC